MFLYFSHPVSILQDHRQSGYAGKLKSVEMNVKIRDVCMVHLKFSNVNTFNDLCIFRCSVCLSSCQIRCGNTNHSLYL